MKLMSVALKDTTVTLRDKKALLILIAMPFVLITILGFALGGVFSGSTSFSKIEVAVVDYDKDELSKSLVDDVLKSKDLAKLLVVRKMDEKKARRLISLGDLDSAVIIPENFSQTITRGEPSRIKVLGDPGHEIKAGIVRGIIQSFANYVSASQVEIKTAIGFLNESGAVSPQRVQHLTTMLIRASSEGKKKELIAVEEKNTAEEKRISSMQYYSAGMMVQFVLFGAMFGAFSILEERNNRTLSRLLSTPTGKLSILGGKLGGVYLIGAIQFFALIAATRLILGVYWGKSIAGIGILGAATILAVTGLTIFIAAITKSEKAADAFSMVLIMVMSALGGSWVPLQAFPVWFRQISKVTINGWAMQGFTRLMADAGLQVVLLPSLILVLIGTVLFAIGTWRFSYE